jgi:putative endonuclease
MPPSRSPQKRLHSRTGRAGEALARRTLEARGYHILASNWRARGELRGEIDLVATEGGDLVFIEVKTRRSAAYGSAAEAITPAKARRLLALAQAYIAEACSAGGPEPSWRIDVVTIEIDRAGRPSVEIIRNAVEA